MDEEAEHGRAGSSGGKTTSAAATAGEPTISDLGNARKLASKMGMDTTKLLELVAKPSAFGLLDKLEALEELGGE